MKKIITIITLFTSAAVYAYDTYYSPYYERFKIAGTLQQKDQQCPKICGMFWDTWVRDEAVDLGNGMIGCNCAEVEPGKVGYLVKGLATKDRCNQICADRGGSLLSTRQLSTGADVTRGYCYCTH